MAHAGVLPPADFRLHAFWQPLDAPILVRAPESMIQEATRSQGGEQASPLQVLTSEAWYLPAVEFLLDPGVAEHAICSSGFSRRSWAAVAPSCVPTDRVPRFPAAFGRRNRLASALLGHRRDARLYFGRRRPAATRDGTARSRHIGDVRGHRAASQGGPGTQLQAPGACFQQQTTTRRGSGPWSRWQPQYIVTCQYCEYV